MSSLLFDVKESFLLLLLLPYVHKILECFICYNAQMLNFGECSIYETGNINTKMMVVSTYFLMVSNSEIPCIRGYPNSTESVHPR